MLLCYTWGIQDSKGRATVPLPTFTVVCRQRVWQKMLELS